MSKQLAEFLLADGSTFLVVEFPPFFKGLGGICKIATVQKNDLWYIFYVGQSPL
jgi:hypothetical protein